MPTDPALFAMPDPMALVLGASGFLAVLITLRFIAATMLPHGHRLSRAAEAMDAPFWAVQASEQQTRFRHARPDDDGPAPCA